MIINSYKSIFRLVIPSQSNELFNKTPNLLEDVMRRNFHRVTNNASWGFCVLLVLFSFLGGKNEMPKLPDGNYRNHEILQ